MVVQMNKKVKISLIIAIIVFMGFAGAVMGNRISTKPPERVKERFNKEFQDQDQNAGRPPPVEQFNVRGYVILKSALTMINMTISVILIFIYIQLYRKIKSNFTLGLMIVMFSFLVYSITSNPIFHVMFGYWGFGMGPFQMLPEIFATIALSILLYLSLK